MIYVKGQKGKRSKKEVRLSLQNLFGSTVFYVWEGGKITHQFGVDEMFALAMQTEAGLALQSFKKARSGNAG